MDREEELAPKQMLAIQISIDTPLSTLEHT